MKGKPASEEKEKGKRQKESHLLPDLGIFMRSVVFGEGPFMGDRFRLQALHA